MKRRSMVISGLVVALLVLAALLLPASSSAAPAAKAITVKWAATYPETDTRTQGMQRYADLVKQRSEGRLILKIFAGESLSKGTQEFDMAKAGNIDMLAINIAYEVGKVPILEGTMLPFYATAEQLDGLFTKLSPIHTKYLAQQNIKYLYGHSHGYQQAYHRSKFLKTLADWQGTKMRLSGGYQAKFAQSMGAGIVSVSAPEQYMALQTATVDGTATSASSYLSFKLPEVAPYVTICNWQSSALLIGINTNVWNSIPADLQKIMLDAAPEGQKNTIAMINDFDKKAPEAMTKAGSKIYTLTTEERAAYIKQAQPLWDEFASKGADNKAIVDVLRALK